MPSAVRVWKPMELAQVVLLTLALVALVDSLADLAVRVL
jgi:hypothetical protein